MEPFSFILFGATGDLARLKILPALYNLYQKGYVSEQISILATGRSDFNDRSFRDYTLAIWGKYYGIELDTGIAEKLLERIYYVRGDLNEAGFYRSVRNRLKELEVEGMAGGNHLIHMAVLPSLYGIVSEHLGQAEFNSSEHGWARLLIEKPFGHNLTSARELDHILGRYFKEEQIYRLDHYLGKEPVQNILAFRFANGIFEPLWNNRYIDHIQIHALEEIGVEGRGAFYDRVGAVRDVVQNHLLQLLAVATMDEPGELHGEAVRVERCRLLKALKPITSLEESVVRGQYEGYLDIENVGEKSKTETFVAIKAEIDTPRWKGVPIFIRTGKKLPRRVTDIDIVFKGIEVPSPNVLTLRIAPNEGIAWRILVKRPGPELKLQEAAMQFCYKDLPGRLMEPYERLLLDATRGDQILFARTEGVEAQWQFIDPILEAFDSNVVPLLPYKAGTYGPNEADRLVTPSSARWLEPSLDVCPI